jgi:hypothetical protein
MLYMQVTMSQKKHNEKYDEMLSHLIFVPTQPTKLLNLRTTIKRSRLERRLVPKGNSKLHGDCDVGEPSTGTSN